MNLEGCGQDELEIVEKKNGSLDDSNFAECKWESNKDMVQINDKVQIEKTSY